MDIDGLLHGNRALQAGRCQGGNDHETVAEVLDLRGPGRRYRLPQQREVHPPQIVGFSGRHACRQRGRSDHVGEQHRHMLGVSHRASLLFATVVPGLP